MLNADDATSVDETPSLGGLQEWLDAGLAHSCLDQRLCMDAQQQ